MSKYRSVILPTAILMLIAAACSDDSGSNGDGDNGGSSNASGSSGSSGNGGSSASSGSSGTSGSAATGGSVVLTGGTSGNGGAGGQTFDGGSVPLTPDEAETIRGQACTGWTSEPEVLPAVLELVVDVSSSMNQRAPGTNQSKWEVTRDALLEAIVGVEGPGLPANLSVGLVFYPNRDDVQPTRQPQDIQACVNTDAAIPIDRLGGPDADQRQLIRDSIARVRLETSTPTHDAYRFAFDEQLAPSNASGQKYMLLITDGAPTISLGCTNENGRISEIDPEPIVDEITRVAGQGVRTFLIGSPGSEPNREWMSRAAVIAGTPLEGCHIDGPDYCHMDMTEATNFADALRSGLARVIGEIAPCSFTFADAPPGQSIDPNKINVLLTNGDGANLIVRDDVGDCTEGWQLTDDQEVLLCPDTCNQVQSDPSSRLEVRFGCATIGMPIE